MKQLVSVLLAVFFGISCASAVKPYPSEKRYLIAITNFNLKTTRDIHNEKLENLNREKMTGILLESGRVRIAEREKIDRILQEQKLGQTGLIDEKSAARIGKIAGVDAVLIGEITPLRLGVEKTAGGRSATIELTVSGKLINVTTGEIIASVVKSGRDTVPMVKGTKMIKKMKIKPLLDRLIEEFTRSLTEKIPAKP